MTTAQSLHEAIGGWAAATPDAVALAAPGRKPMTYATFAAQMAGTVGSLRALGVARDGRVAILLPNGPESAAATLSIAAGAVAVPMRSDVRRHEASSVFDEIGVAALVVLQGDASEARSAAVELGVRVLELVPCGDGPAGTFSFAGLAGTYEGELDFGTPSDVALLLRTSGTTARAKVVPMTHLQICSASGYTAAALGLTADDCCLNPVTLVHAHGLLAGVLAPLLAGGSAFLPPDFDPERFWQWFEETRPTWITAVPTILQAILGTAGRHHDAIARGRMRLIRSASAYLPDMVRARVEELFGVLISESYGLTEASQLTYTPLDRNLRKVGSLGVARTSEVGVMDEAGRLLPPGQEGQIVARGPAVMKGYLGLPDDEQPFRDGWFLTGDIGHLDADGHLWMTSRIKDQINRGGEKISPQEVDQVLLEHPAVAQAMAFPLEHATLGEEVAAAVVLAPGSSATADDIRSHARSRLPASKVPRRLFVVAEMPTNATGKLVRKEMANKLRHLMVAPGDAVPTNDMERLLTGLWADVFGLDHVSVEDDFFDLGGDSLLAERLFAAMAPFFPLDQDGKGFGGLQPGVLWDAPTIRRLVERIAGSAYETLDRPLVEVQRGGDGPPFVMLTGDWMGFYVRKLAQDLPPEQPVYAFSPHDVMSEGAFTTIEQMAEDYLATLRASYPRGPYMLGGYSAAGFVAVEMARRLEAMGERVPLVFVIDSKLPSLRRRYLQSLARAVGRVLRWDSETQLDTFVAWQGKLVELKRRVRNFLVGRWRGVVDSDDEIQWLPASVHIALHRILDRYAPRPYDGEIDLVCADRGPVVLNGLVPRWRQACTVLRVHRVPGDHSTCLTEHIDVVARCLADCVDRAVGEREVRSATV